MTKVLTFKPRHQYVRAMRIILGETTRSQVLGLCPLANIGVLYVGRKPVETDIRWAHLPDGSELSRDGDWLVEIAPGKFSFIADTDFHNQYESAE